MAQPSEQNTYEWREIIAVVGSLLGLGLLVGLIIFLIIQQQYVLAIVLGVFTFVLLVILIILGYTSPRFKWIGIGIYKTPDSGYHRPRTFWDWLQLLIIPAVLIGATIVFNYAQTQNSNTLSENQHKADLNLAQDQQREDVLVNYEKDISTLQGTSQDRDSFRAVARARTLAALSVLDSDRKGLLIQFLYDTRLTTTRHPIIDLSNANLITANLSEVTLSRINLSGVNLSDANLSGAHLERAYLEGVILNGANLSGTHLEGAYLWHAKIIGTDLSKTFLHGADLSEATIQRSKVEVDKLRTPANSPACPGSRSDLSDATLPTHWTSDLSADKKSQASLSQVTDPNVDGNAMQISFLGGEPYTVVSATFHLSPNNTVQALELSMCFYFTDLTPVHAISFSVNRWMNNQRYEMALQWEAVDDVSPRPGTPTWRLWTGKQWQDISLPQGQQGLTEGNWYRLDLQGEIVSGQVHYVSFALDGDTHQLDQIFKPVPFQSQDGLDFGVQLSSNARGEPYDIYIDRANLQWS